MLDLPTVLREVDSWPVDDRIRLVQEVWERLVEGGVEPELSDAQKAEFDRRLADPGSVTTWEAIKEHVRRPR